MSVTPRWLSTSGALATIAPRQARTAFAPSDPARLLTLLIFLLLSCNVPVTACAGAVGRAESSTGEASQFADEYIKRFKETARLEVKAEIGDREAGLSDTDDRGTLLRDLSALDTRSRNAAAALLEKNFDQCDRDLAAARTRVDKEIDGLIAQWRELRAERNEYKFQLFDLEAQQRIFGQIASLVNVDNRWLWVCGTLAAATVISLYIHERRHQFRRLLWVRKTRFVALLAALALLIVIPTIPAALTFLLGNQVYESLAALGAGSKLSPSNDLTDEIEQLKQKQAELEARVNGAKERNAFRRERQQVLSATFGPDSKVPTQWLNDRGLSEELAAGIGIQKKVAEAIKEDVAAAAKLKVELKSHGQSVASLQHTKRMIGGGLGAVLLIVSGGTGVVLNRFIRRRTERVAQTCPRCMATGKLKRVPPSGGGPTDRNLEEVRCSNIIRDDPYEECDFQFFAQYRDYAKLSFPTLGVAESGKTHALTMVYRELNQGRYPDKVHFEKVKSGGSEAFDQLVERILSHRMGTSATEAERLPHPLIFNFRDRDPFGTSDVLVNIFDYAGAITAVRSLSDFDRRRALNGDGFFFFLDTSAPIEMQSAALNNFRQDLRVLKKLRAGRRIHTPVALCVTKIDLLVNAPYARTGNAINDFYSELSRVDQSSAPLSLELIRRRSTLVAQLRDVIWPNWEIERQVRGLFGERFMFFPVTPVGLNELGEKDLGKRTINPYGILEPLMWLLHMNGYPVLLD